MTTPHRCPLCDGQRSAQSIGVGRVPCCACRGIGIVWSPPAVPLQKEPGPPYSPKSWADRMERAVRGLCLGVDEDMKRVTTPVVEQLIAEAESLIRDRWEWRPMETAPKDGRLVVLRWRQHLPSRMYELGRWTNEGWAIPRGRGRDDFFDGWLPIPGAEAPR